MKDLRAFIDLLEERGELLVVKDQLRPRFEISAFVRLMVERGFNKAFLFSDVQGYGVPVVANLLGSRKRLALALGVEEGELGSFFAERRKRLLEPEVVDDSPVKEVKVLGDVDVLEHMPVLTHHEMDTGPYLTCSMVISKDPETGIRGMGIHRIQVKGPNRLGVFLGSPPLSHFLAKAERLGSSLPVAIVNGVDPVTLFSSVVWAPHGVDKFAIAGSLRGSPVPLVRCELLDLEVPAYSEFVLEGFITPGVREPEGPFGESTGYYFTFQNPVVEVKALTRRKDPMYQALVPFSGEEDVILGFSWEMDRLMEVKGRFPCVLAVRFFYLGMLTVIQVEDPPSGEVEGIIRYFMDQPFSKVVVVVDNDVNPGNLNEVMWAVSTRSYFDRDAIVKGDLPGFMIDPSSTAGRNAPELFNMLVTRTVKLGIDATKPASQRERFRKVDVPPEVRGRVGRLVDMYLSRG